MGYFSLPYNEFEPIDQVKEYEKKLTELNKEHEIVILEELGQMLRPYTRKEIVIPYFDKHLK